MRPRHWNFSLAATLWLVCPFDLVVSLGMDLYLPALADLPGLLGTSPERVQTTLGGYLVILGAGQLLLGPLSDRVGRRPVLLGGAALFALASLGLAFVRAWWPFFGLRMIEAGGGAAMLVAMFATVRDVYGDRPEGRAIYGTMSGLLVLVPAFGPLVGALLLRAHGIAAVFVALAGWCTIAGMHALLRWPETRPLEHTGGVRWRDVRAIVSHRQLWLYALGYGVAMGSFFVTFSIAPPLLIGRLAYSPIRFSLWFGTVALVLLATTRLARTIVERHEPSWCLTRGMSIILAGAGVAAALTRIDAGVLGLMVPAWIMAVGIALTMSVAAAGALAPFGTTAGTATAVFGCVGTLLSVSGGTLAVWCAPGTWALTGFGAIGALLVLGLSRNWLNQPTSDP